MIARRAIDVTCGSRVACAKGACGLRINNNITAENSHRQLGINQRSLGVNTERLSSGTRVNRPADDSAGFSISEKMRTQIRGLNRTSLNIQDGSSLL